MKKTGLFFNGDYHLQKSLSFQDIWNMKLHEVFYIMNHMYPNTGCYLFNDSLVKNVNANWVTDKDIDSFSEQYKSVITTLYHHCGIIGIRSDEVAYLKRILDTGIKYITLSLGFADNFQPGSDVGKKLLYQFSRMAERAELGVRNEYTADILNKHGITNIRIIGCPSLYYHMDRDFQVLPKKDKIESINFNSNLMSTLLPRFIRQKPPIIQYILEYYHKHPEHTHFTLQQLPGKNINLNSGRIDEEIKEFLLETGRYYFSVDDWIMGLRNDDFSFGTCFHGNVAAVLSKVPALFVVSDERMKGLCDYHHLPYIDMKAFNKNSSRPLEYYYELADYTAFNRHYAKTYDNFVDFCRKNDVDLKIDDSCGRIF